MAVDKTVAKHPLSGESIPAPFATPRCFTPKTIFPVKFNNSPEKAVIEND